MEGDKIYTEEKQKIEDEEEEFRTDSEDGE